MRERVRSRIPEPGDAWTFDMRKSRAPSRIVSYGPVPRTMLDRCVIAIVLVCSFTTVISPLEYHLFDLLPNETRLDTRIFWPAMAAAAVLLLLRARPPSARFTWPPHIVWLFAYLAFAGASVVWSRNPEVSATRYMQQAMVVISIVLPALLAGATVDIMRALFLWCFAPAALLSVLFVLNNEPSVVAALKGYPGFFLGKNYLGEFSGITFLLALHETFHPGLRRVSGLAFLVVATLLLFLSNSKTAFGLALVAPFLATLTLMISKGSRVSPAIILSAIPLFYLAASSVSNFNIYRISYLLYGDSSMTGRTVIWDFASYEISRRPILGWGYQAFWLAGPDAPSIVDAPGWVKTMPDGHNGYVDTKLELGYVGLVFLLAFIMSTLHGIGRVAKRSFARAGLLLSLALFIIIYNFSESLWMRGYEFLWVVFLIIAAEVGRYWQMFPVRRKASQPGRKVVSHSSLRELKHDVRGGNA